MTVESASTQFEESIGKCSRDLGRNADGLAVLRADESGAVSDREAAEPDRSLRAGPEPRFEEARPILRRLIEVLPVIARECE